VRGLVLIDPPALGDWREPGEFNRRRLERGIRLARRGASLARWGVVRTLLLLANPRMMGLGKRLAKAVSRKGEQVAARMVGEIKKLPPSEWGVIRAHWSQVRGFESMVRHLEALTPACRLAGDSRLPAVRVAVVSAAKASTAERAEHEALASRPDGRLWVTAWSGHWPHLDEPELVRCAILWALHLT
jgi:pimeloyl-ACP methyl ester carboxylesterase